MTLKKKSASVAILYNGNEKVVLPEPEATKRDLKFDLSLSNI